MNNIEHNYKKIIAYIWLAGCFIFDIWYQIVPGKYMVDGDLASEMVLANLLNKEGSILSKNWIYSSEIRVFETQWFYRIGLFIFPNNWHRARIFAAAIIIGLTAFAFIYLFDAIKQKEVGIWGAGFLILPFSFWHLFLNIWGLYYLIYIIFSLLIVGLILKNIDTPKLYRNILICILSLMSGLNGIRQPMVLIVPLIITIAIVFIYYIPGEGKLKENRSLIISTGLACVYSALGYVINSRYLKKLYTFQSYEDVKWKNSYENAEEIYRDFLTLFGFQDDTLLFRGRGIASAIGVMIAIFLVICSVNLLRHIKEKTLVEKILILLFPVSIGIQGLIFIFLGNYKINYWIPYIPYAIIIICLRIKDYQKTLYKAFIYTAMSFGLIFCSVATVKGELDKPLRAIPELVEVTKWLQEEGYTRVVTSFWKSNTIVEYSNGTIETWDVKLLKWAPHFWLQEKKYTEIPEHDYALVLEYASGEDINDYVSFLSYYELVYEDEKIQVYYVE